MGSHLEITRLTRRLIREVNALYAAGSERESYWVSLQEGLGTPRMSGFIQHNLLDFMWDASRHTRVREPLKALGEHLDEVFGASLVRNSHGVSQLLGSQHMRDVKIIGSAALAAANGKTTSHDVRALADTLLNELTSNSYTWQLVVPLEGPAFPPASRFFRLDPACRIRVLPLDERELLINADMIHLSGATQASVARSRVALEYTITVPADKELGLPAFNEMVKSSQLTATLLSSIAGTDIRIAGFFAAPRFMYPLAIPFSHVPEMPIYEALADSLELTKPVGRQLHRAFNNAHSGPNSRVTHIALSRLYEVMRHKDPADRLIDAWIALESLFLSDNTAELKFRAAMRIAGFSDSPDSLAVYDFVRRSYDMRSKLVHGGLPKLAILKETADGTVSLARRSLLRVLESPQPFDPADIERAILSKRSGC